MTLSFRYREVSVARETKYRALSLCRSYTLPRGVRTLYLNVFRIVRSAPSRKSRRAYADVCKEDVPPFNIQTIDLGARRSR
jgi:hypothetical protein